MGSELVVHGETSDVELGPVPTVLEVGRRRQEGARSRKARYTVAAQADKQVLAADDPIPVCRRERVFDAAARSPSCLGSGDGGREGSLKSGIKDSAREEGIVRRLLHVAICEPPRAVDEQAIKGNAQSSAHGAKPINLAVHEFRAVQSKTSPSSGGQWYR